MMLSLRKQKGSDVRASKAVGSVSLARHWPSRSREGQPRFSAVVVSMYSSEDSRKTYHTFIFACSSLLFVFASIC